jgi:vancomycin resistance protein YoaR
VNPVRAIVIAALAVAAGTSGIYVRSLAQPGAIAGLRVGGMTARDADAMADDWVGGKFAFVLGKDRIEVTRKEAGFVVDRTALRNLLATTGRGGNPLSDLRTRIAARRGRVDLPMPVAIDTRRALETLSDLKDRLDRPPVDAKFDLDNHTVAKEQPGLLVQAYESVVALEDAAGHGKSEAELQAFVMPPQVTSKDLSSIDIGTVMGSWQTPYSLSTVDSDRTYNLKVGAGKVDGTVIAPHATFSFNQVTGDRTEKEGYRVAPVIQAGELVDGLAGGMCQIASTLHAAAWFAGLDIEESTPHSRPSAYITMGLDSTVVYPTTDLKLRNPYDFPVVIHYRVNQGLVRAEILGKPRGVKVGFEREILEKAAFGHATRTDPTMPAGQKVIDQEGHEGFKIKRRRIVYDKRIDQPLRKPEEKVLWYPPTTEYMRVGTGPRKLKPKDIPPRHHIPAPEKPDANGLFRIIR